MKEWFINFSFVFFYEPNFSKINGTCCEEVSPLSRYYPQDCALFRHYTYMAHYTNWHNWTNYNTLDRQITLVHNTWSTYIVMARAFWSHSNAHFSLSVIHDAYKIAVYSQISENSQLQNYQVIMDVQDKRQTCVVMKLKFQLI